MIELGGNINLKGFDLLDVGELVVLKKIVGNRIRDISEKARSYESMTLTLDNKRLNALLQINGKNLSAAVENKNLFFALNDLFNSLEKKI